MLGASKGSKFNLAITCHSSLLLREVLRAIIFCPFEDLLDLSDLAHAFLLVLGLFVMTLYHVDQLFDVVAGHDDVADLFFGLHLLPHHKGVHLLFRDHTLADGFLRVLFDLFSEFISELKQVVVYFN